MAALPCHVSSKTEEQRKPPCLAPKSLRKTSRLAFPPRLVFIIRSLAHSIFLCILQSTISNIYGIYFAFIKTLEQGNKETGNNMQVICIVSIGHTPSPFPSLFFNIAMVSQTQNVARLFLLVSPSQSYLLTSTTSRKLATQHPWCMTWLNLFCPNDCKLLNHRRP